MNARQELVTALRYRCRRSIQLAKSMRDAKTLKILITWIETAVFRDVGLTVFAIHGCSPTDRIFTIRSNIAGCNFALRDFWFVWFKSLRTMQNQRMIQVGS